MGARQALALQFPLLLTVADAVVSGRIAGHQARHQDGTGGLAAARQRLIAAQQSPAARPAQVQARGSPGRHSAGGPIQTRAVAVEQAEVGRGPQAPIMEPRQTGHRAAQDTLGLMVSHTDAAAGEVRSTPRRAPEGARVQGLAAAATIRARQGPQILLVAVGGRGAVMLVLPLVAQVAAVVTVAAVAVAVAWA